MTERQTDRTHTELKYSDEVNLYCGNMSVAVQGACYTTLIDVLRVTVIADYYTFYKNTFLSSISSIYYTHHLL